MAQSYQMLKLEDIVLPEKVLVVEHYAVHATVHQRPSSPLNHGCNYRGYHNRVVLANSQRDPPTPNQPHKQTTTDSVLQG